MAELRIGTSGWLYDNWKQWLYRDVPRKEWLERYAATFNAVEADGTFYRLQRASTFEDWKQRTPDDFRFAIKGHRYVTHRKRLEHSEDSIILGRDNARPLGAKLAVVLWQIPPNLKKDLERLDEFCRALGRWRSVRHAFEPRHPSWFDHEVRDRLAEARVAICLSDAADWKLWDAVSTDLVYVRLHGHTRTYASSYARSTLRRWADRIEGWLAEDHDVHVYFDNDSEGAAPKNALDLMSLMADHVSTHMKRTSSA